MRGVRAIDGNTKKKFALRNTAGQPSNSIGPKKLVQYLTALVVRLVAWTVISADAHTVCESSGRNVPHPGAKKWVVLNPNMRGLELTNTTLDYCSDLCCLYSAFSHILRRPIPYSLPILTTLLFYSSLPSSLLLFSLFFSSYSSLHLCIYITLTYILFRNL